jgi:two-component system chemotaxis sensor kinase CheA
MNPKDVYDLLFMPGFSTAEQVTDLSGRGVGLDVVKTSIEKLKGTIQIESEPNAGTTFILSIPLTSSIADGILVKVGSSSCILPMENIRDLERFHAVQITEMNEETRVIDIGGRVMPLIEVSRIFGEHITLKSREEMRVTEGMVIVIEVDERPFGLVVDEIIGQVQVVLKPLDKIFEDVECVSGVAILGDGHVALVLAPHMLADSYAKLLASQPVGGRKAA